MRRDRCAHASIKVTEKHYTPWVKTLQDKLGADAMKGWPSAPPGKKRQGRGRLVSQGQRRKSNRTH